MSTNPGATTAPSAAISRRPRPVTLPTSVIRPSRTATSAVRGGLPVPSTTVPARTTRSCSAMPSSFVRRLRVCHSSTDAEHVVTEPDPAELAGGGSWQLPELDGGGALEAGEPTPAVLDQLGSQPVRGLPRDVV